MNSTFCKSKILISGVLLASLFGCNIGGSGAGVGSSPQKLYMAGQNGSSLTNGGSLNIISSTNGGYSWSNSLLSGVYGGLNYENFNTSIAYGDGVWVAGGSNTGTVLVSTDGVIFTPVAFAGSQINGVTINCIMFDGSKFILGLSSGAIYYSNHEGTTWYPAFSPMTTPVNSIAYNGTSTYIAVGGISYSTSSDGKTWSAESGVSGASNLNSIVFDSVHSRFIAADTGAHGMFSTSGANPVTWAESTMTNPMSSVATDGKGNTVALGYNTPYLVGQYSTDGTTWTEITQQESVATNISQVVYDNSHQIFVAIGYGATSTTGPLTIITNRSESDWSSANVLSPSSPQYNNYNGTALNSAAVATGGGKTYFISGFATSQYPRASGEIFYTNNYTNYSHAISGFATSQMLATSNGIFAIGSSMLFNSTTPILHSTDNGDTWSLIAIDGVDDSANAAGFAGIAELNGTTLVVRSTINSNESNDIYTTTNGTTWNTLIPSFSDSQQQISPTRLIAANNLFVLGTSNGQIYTSVDGVTWSLRANIGVQINDIIYANGGFVAITNSGLISQSSDGITWSLNNSILPFGALNLYQIVYANGEYSILTNSGYNGGNYAPVFQRNTLSAPITTVSGQNANMILSSSDLNNWSALSQYPEFQLNQLYFADQNYLSFISSSVLMSSDVNSLSTNTSATALDSGFSSSSLNPSGNGLSPNFNFTAQ